MPAFIVFLLLTVFSAAPAAAETFAPAPGKTLLFIGQDRQTIADYVRATGTVPAGTMLYTSVQELKGLESAVEYGAGPQDGNNLLLAYPHAAVQLGLYMVDALDGVLAGEYDRNLRRLAKWIRHAQRPVYLRIGYEFDNPENRYDPEKYKQAFRYIVDFMHRQGVSNAAYVWHSYVAREEVRPWMDWYPGDDYVDWFGGSVFSTGLIPAATRLLELAREHRKPFMIAESTPSGMYTPRGKLDWFKHIFRFINEHQVEAFCYINSNWDVMPMFAGQSWGDARIQKDPQVKEFWLNEVRQPRYLH